MFMDYNKKLAVVGAVVLAALLTWWFWLDMKGDGVSNTPNDIFINPDHANVSLPGTSVVPGGEVKTVSPSGARLPVPPVLNRPTDFPAATLEPTVKAIILGKLKESIRELKRDANNIDAWTMLGLHRKALGDYVGARDAWEYAKALNPTNITPWNNLADLYHFNLAEYQKSEENWKQTIKISPDYIAGYRGLVELYTYSLKAKSSEVPPVLKGGIAKNPDNVELRVVLARYYGDAGRIAEAKTVYREAIVVAEKLKNTALVAALNADLAALK